MGTTDLSDADAPATDAGAEWDETRARTVVGDALTRYGAALSRISADPDGAPGPGTPERARWDAVVVAGSVLSVELLDRTSRRALEQRVIIVPSPEGVSFRHHLVEVVRVDPDAITFSWCGWSPGIGRSIDDGRIVDDAVGHATGSGRVVHDPDGWRLAALDQDDIALLEPGSPDPCPTDADPVPGR